MDLIEVSGLSKRFGGIVALERRRASPPAPARCMRSSARTAPARAPHPDPRRRHPPRRRRDPRSTASPTARPAPTRPQAARHRRRLPGAVADPRPHASSRTSGSATSRAPASAPSTAGALRRQTLALFARYRFPALAPRPGGAPPDPRRAPDRRDRQGPRQGPAHPHPRRGDLGAARPRGRMAARPHPQLAAEGRLVIFISHRMAEVRGVADRLTIFRNGAHRRRPRGQRGQRRRRSSPR